MYMLSYTTCICVRHIIYAYIVKNAEMQQIYWYVSCWIWTTNQFIVKCYKSVEDLSIPWHVGWKSWESYMTRISCHLCVQERHVTSHVIHLNETVAWTVVLSVRRNEMKTRGLEAYQKSVKPLISAGSCWSSSLNTEEACWWLRVHLDWALPIYIAGYSGIC